MIVKANKIYYVSQDEMNNPDIQKKLEGEIIRPLMYTMNYKTGKRIVNAHSSNRQLRRFYNKNEGKHKYHTNKVYMQKQDQKYQWLKEGFTTPEKYVFFHKKHGGNYFKYLKKKQTRGRK